MILDDLHNGIHQLVCENATSVMSGKTTAETLGSVFDFAIGQLGCSLAHAWSVDPRGDRLVLVAQQYSRSITVGVNEVIDVATSLTGIALETHEPTPHYSLENRDERSFANPKLAYELGIQSFLSLPIRNIGNPHQVTQVLNFDFPHRLPESLGNSQSIEELRDWAEMIAATVESNLRERTFRMSARVSQTLGRIEQLTPDTAYTAFAKVVREGVDSDWVSVYSENWNGTALTLQGTSTGKDFVDTDGSAVPAMVNSVWKENRELLVPDSPDPEELRMLIGEVPIDVQSLILVPVHDVRGRCVGVVRCVNIRRDKLKPWRPPNSYDDIAIVESMERAFAPPLDMLLEAQRHDASLQRMTHELRVPIMALRAVHERMRREYQLVADKEYFQFQYPYFDDVETFTSVMQRQLQSLQIAHEGPGQLRILRQRVTLLSSVVQPAIKFMLPVLRQRGMGGRQIIHSGFESIPEIYADAGLLTQVVFNLLENMVKYFPATKAPSEFRGTVTCTRTASELSIIFSDNGPGIPDSDREQIFEFGYRGATAANSNVQGGGLGCWLAREIARRHDGDLQVRSNYPFELLLTLPVPHDIHFRPGYLSGM